MTTPNSKTLARPTAASREVAVERNLTEIEQLDTLLTQRLGGDPNGYRDLLTDTTVSGVWAQRQTALTKLERQVLPHDPDNAADVEAAKFVAAQLQRLNFDAVLKAMHWGVFYGMAVGEVMWGIEDGKVVLDNVLVRDRGKFKYDLARQLIYTGNGADEVMPPRKFWTFSAGGDTTDNPYGLGLAHFLYWPVLFKKSNVKFWLVGNEKAATSVPHGQYDPRSPTTDYAKLCEYMDEAIALVVLGQVMTSQAVGGQYKAEIQDEVKDDIVKADADLLCASFNETIAVWLTEWNFPNARPPKLWLRTEETKDLQKLADTYAKIAALGYRPTQAQLEQDFGGAWEAMPAASALPEVADGDAHDFAESAPADTPDDMGSRLARDIAPHGEAWLAQISAELASSETLLQFRERLDELAGALPLDVYADIFARATTAAHLAGRHDAKGEGA